MLKTLHTEIMTSSQKLYEIRDDIVPILQMKTWEPRKFKQLAQGYSDGKQQR